MAEQVEKYRLPPGVDADLAVGVSNDECEPYIRRGGVAYIKRGAELYDGDAGLFFDGHEAVIRQYCEDWAGNAYYFVLNRARRERDLFFRAGDTRPICLFGRVENLRGIPLPER